jgi:histidinol-phosphate aminotransferase
MNDIHQLVRDHILSMPIYEPIQPYKILSKKLGISEDQIIKLDANENPYGPLPEVMTALTNLEHIHIYPDPDSIQLRKVLSEFHNVPFENLLVGAGADELIDLIIRATIEPGESIINCPPTFGMYEFDGDLNRANVINIPRFKDFTINIDLIEETVKKFKPKLLFLASPNNPDGSILSYDQIDRLINLPLYVILDEAYTNFAPTGTSYIHHPNTDKNLLVLRTFSKWAGLAGLRIGYGVFPQSLVKFLWKIKQPYNISVAAEAAAIVSLQNAQKLNSIAERIINERERLKLLLKNNIPYLNPYPSKANFLLCKVHEVDAKKLKHTLEGCGIMVRYFNKPGLKDHIRISVGKPEHTDLLIENLIELEYIYANSRNFP